MFVRMMFAVSMAVALPLQAVAADSRVVNELESTLVRLAEMGALERQAGQPLVIDQPARVKYELGTVVDARSGADGLTVLAVTPGGAAEQLGLQVGDRLLDVNGTALSGVQDPGHAMLAAIDDRDGALRVQVARGGETLSMAGRAEAVLVPAFRLAVAGASSEADGCGRVSTAVRPPISEDIYPLVLHEIDGQLPGALDQQVFRLGSGRHHLKVSEAIRDDRFTFLENRKRARLFRYERYKYLVIDVKPDTHYRIGARLIRGPDTDIREGTYWEPVVWREFSEGCR